MNYTHILIVIRSKNPNSLPFIEVLDYLNATLL